MSAYGQDLPERKVSDCVALHRQPSARSGVRGRQWQPCRALARVAVVVGTGRDGGGTGEREVQTATCWWVGVVAGPSALPEQPLWQSPTDHVLALAKRRAVIGL